MDEMPNEYIEVPDAVEAINNGACLVDVRTKEEFDSGHLLGAINIPHDSLVVRLDELAEYKDKKIILYCKSGGRSQFAAEVLRDAGFPDSWNAGGYKELLAQQEKIK